MINGNGLLFGNNSMNSINDSISKYYSLENNLLVHYSLASRGNALFFQKLAVNSVFKMLVRKHSFGLNMHSLGGGRFTDIGTNFQHKILYLTSHMQLNRKVNFSFTDTELLGSFRNKKYLSRLRGTHKNIAKTMEPLRGLTEKLYVQDWSYLEGTVFGNSFRFQNVMPSAFRAMGMKGLIGYSVWENIITGNTGLNFKSISNYLVHTTFNTVHFTRYHWYNSIKNLRNYKNPINAFDLSGDNKKGFDLAEASYKNYTVGLKYKLYATSPRISNKKPDIEKELKIKRPAGKSFYRQLVKKHNRWRLAMAFWAKKIWFFKKNYRFWNYMRGMSNYYFRGFRVLLNFSFRLDFYILRLFGIKNLKFARTLIKSGHVFVGNSVSNNTYTIAPRFSILSISKRATLWLTKQSYLRYFKVNGMESSQKKKRFRTLKSTSLKFCRQHRDLNFWGSLKNTRYAMFYGELVDVLNTDQKKTKFFSLNYFYYQKSIASAWW